jgi:hypothetical protein
MKKLQAAMEYLMTYGWAILIIALALGVLWSLGVLNPSKLKPIVCQFPAPFACSNPVATTTGSVSITLAQASGQTIYINRIACVDSSLIGSNGLPKNNTYWTNQATGLTPSPSGFDLASGSTKTFSGIKCYGPGGSQWSGPIGSIFGGNLILNYSMGASSAAPYYYSAGSISVQVTQV